MFNLHKTQRVVLECLLSFSRSGSRVPSKARVFESGDRDAENLKSENESLTLKKP